MSISSPSAIAEWNELNHVIHAVDRRSIIAGGADALRVRVGLAGEQTSADTLERLLPTIRNYMNFESDALRDAEFEHLNRIRESVSVEDNARELAKFLTIPQEKGREIAEANYLFYD